MTARKPPYKLCDGNLPISKKCIHRMGNGKCKKRSDICYFKSAREDNVTTESEVKPTGEGVMADNFKETIRILDGTILSTQSYVNKGFREGDGEWNHGIREEMRNLARLQVQRDALINFQSLITARETAAREGVCDNIDEKVSDYMNADGDTITIGTTDFLKILSKIRKQGGSDGR